MKIGVISDTHISPGFDVMNLLSGKSNNDPEYLHELVKPYFSDVKAIIHAGDITHMAVIESLSRLGEVFAVAGNMDPNNVYHSLGDRKIIELNGFKIGIMHGWGSGEGLSLKIRQKFIADKVDCIIFGHSHNPYNKIEDNILMFNPGSPTDKRFAKSRNIGILHIEDKIWGEHICLD